MKLLEEIRDRFASTQESGTLAIAINDLPEEYPAYIIRIPDGYGVAVRISDEMEVAERFNSCNLRTGKLALYGATANYLMLISSYNEFRYEFAALCAEFVDPGKAGENRKAILADPIKWWKNWKALVGNADKEQLVYSTIAEMMALEHILKTDSSAEWAATRLGSHDIECDSKSYEVKSTCKRYGASVIIAGQHQLMHDKPLYLYFCRMEESFEGVSINDMKQRLIDGGYDPGTLEAQLQRLGFERGASIRDRKYKFLEKRKYAVDEEFPSITERSFKDNRVPLGIIHLEYTVDLDILHFTAW